MGSGFFASIYTRIAFAAVVVFAGVAAGIIVGDMVVEGRNAAGITEARMIL